MHILTEYAHFLKIKEKVIITENCVYKKYLPYYFTVLGCNQNKIKVIIKVQTDITVFWTFSVYFGYLEVCRISQECRKKNCDVGTKKD